MNTRRIAAIAVLAAFLVPILAWSLPEFSRVLPLSEEPGRSLVLVIVLQSLLAQRLFSLRKSAETATARAHAQQALWFAAATVVTVFVGAVLRP